MNQEKLAFLKEKFLPIIKTIQKDTPALWGKMDAQQMVEHFCIVLKTANGKLKVPQIPIDADRLAKMRNFIETDLPFKENTKSPALPEEPIPHHYPNITTALDKLEQELNTMFQVYEENEGLEILNPVFGPLNYTQQVSLIYKHALHHLKQFGLI